MNFHQISFSRRRCDFGGYMTIEAACIMPMVLAVYVLIMYAGFFLYDRCLFTQDAYILCFRESIRKDEGSRVHVQPDLVEGGAARQFGTKYFALVSRTIQTHPGGFAGTHVYLEGSARVNVPGITRLFPLHDDTWQIVFGAGARKSDPPLIIRKYRRIYYIVNAAKDLF